MFVTLGLLRCYDAALGKYLQNFIYFNIASSPVPVHLLIVSKRENSPDLSTLVRWFRTLDRIVGSASVARGTTCDDVNPYQNTSFSFLAFPHCISVLHSHPGKFPANYVPVQLSTFFSRVQGQPHHLDGLRRNAIHLRQDAAASKSFCIRSKNYFGFSLS